MLNSAIIQYQLNIKSARDLETIYVALAAMTSNSVPKEELLRAEIVAVVSAFDTYIHDIVRLGLKCQYQNSVSNPYITNFTNKHSISSLENFEMKIREVHSYKTFQAPKKISEALEMITINNIWTKIKPNIPDVETILQLIIERRNKIAHESDINPTNGLSEKWPINLNMAQRVVYSINDIIINIDTLIKNELSSISC